MEKDGVKYKILIIEDNPGDLILVQEYLDDHILEPQLTSAVNFKQSREFLLQKANAFDIILLDLSLPDKSGVDLVQEVLKLAGAIPVVILTGYTDMPFSIKSLKMGIADYLLKDTLTPFALYKGILHNIDRRKFISALEQSEKRYNDLFHLSPQPMWVYDLETLNFLDVNDAAVKEYGYTSDEFLKMNISQIRAVEERPTFVESHKNVDDKEKHMLSVEKHNLKNGKLIDVELHSNPLLYNNTKSMVILANNVTEKTLYIKEIEGQNTKLKEIAWIQSHIVRAPLARLMGIVDLLSEENNGLNEEQQFFLKEIINSANELDDIIRDISSRTAEAEINKG